MPHTRQRSPNGKNGRMSELHTLRVSVARIAQALGLHDRIPGATENIDPPYEVLAACARQHDRGWNALCAEIINTIERMDRDEAEIS